MIVATLSNVGCQPFFVRLKFNKRSEFVETIDAF